MKNALGTQENLELYNKEGKLVYEFYKNSYGYWFKYTRDGNGNTSAYEDSDGYWYKRTRDENGNELTYEDSKGTRRGFDIPEYTMEEIAERIGNFKIKK
jgi:hypothetical protein